MSFKLNKVYNNIYQISEPFFKQHANIFVFKGTDFDLVVDSGVGLENLKEFLVKNKFRKVKVFLTHAHFDHCGGINHFNFSDLIIKTPIVKNLNNKKLLGLEYLKPSDFNKKFISKTNINVDKFCSNFKIKNTDRIKPFSKKKINNGTFSFEIIHTKGHTDDCYILFDNTNKIIVTGDTLYNGEVYADMPNSNKKMFIQSLDKIKVLDYNVVLSGHNKVMTKKESIIVINNWIKDLI